MGSAKTSTNSASRSGRWWLVERATTCGQEAPNPVHLTRWSSHQNAMERHEKSQTMGPGVCSQFYLSTIS
jgi:hypothetical protein